MTPATLRFETGYDPAGDMLYFSAVGTVADGADEDPDTGLLWRFGKDGRIIGISVADVSIRSQDDIQKIAAEIAQAINWSVDAVRSAFAQCVPPLRDAGE